MPDRRISIYPGTFDPMTNGHLDVIARAAALCDRLVVAVAGSADKQPLLALDERLELMRIETAALDLGTAIDVQPLHGLLVAFATSCNAGIIVRGLRSVTDFDYEAAMASLNHEMAPAIETVFLMARDRHRAISSSLVRQIARSGGDIGAFVPPATQARVLAALGRANPVAQP